MERTTSAVSLESSGAPRCRLCWGEETDEAAGGSPLITPCSCRGSVGFIHVHCLQHWLEVSRSCFYSVYNFVWKSAERFVWNPQNAYTRGCSSHANSQCCLWGCQSAVNLLD